MYVDHIVAYIIIVSYKTPLELQPENSACNLNVVGELYFVFYLNQYPATWHVYNH